jgi:hypothetical protein
MKYHSREISVQKLSSRPSRNKPLDALLDLKYTPYVRFIHHLEKEPDGSIKVDNHYFVVNYLSNKNSKIINTFNTFNSGKLYINIKIDTSNSDEHTDIFSQIMFGSDEFDINIRNDVRNNKSISYIVNIIYSDKIDSGNNLVDAGTNSSGGTTDPFEEVPLIGHINDPS